MSLDKKRIHSRALSSADGGILVNYMIKELELVNFNQVSKYIMGVSQSFSISTGELWILNWNSTDMDDNNVQNNNVSPNIIDCLTRQSDDWCVHYI